MANYLCRTVDELPGYMQTQIIVPEDAKLYAGDIYVANNLNEKLRGNVLTYDIEVINDIKNQIPVIIINNGFETLPDKKLPKGQPDYTLYEYQAGEVLTTIKLCPEIRLEISFDCINNPNQIKRRGYLVPENNGSTLNFVDTLNGVESKVYLVVEALGHFKNGGQFGSQNINSIIARVKYQDIKKEVPEITGIQADVTPNLKVGDANVESGATVLTLNAIGGTAPVQFDFETNDTIGADNGKFVINNNDVNVGADALTEAKQYKVYIKASDGNGKSFKEGFDIPVAEA